MANAWDEEDSSTPPSSPPVPAAIPRRSKFDDEEEDSDVLESWDAAEDSEVEAEKAKKAAEAKAQAEAEEAARKKSKSQRIAERRAENERRRQAEDTSSDEDEDDAARRERLRRTEQDADLQHAEDLFGDIGISKNRSGPKPVITQDPSDPNSTIDLSSLPLFNPTTKAQFDKLRDTLVPIIIANTKKAHYALFMQDFAKQLAKEMSSDQTKKVASGLTALSNEKMKEEKASEKGGKKSKAAKTKTSLVANRNASFKADTTVYDDNFDDDDFM
ncbi:MAG: Translation initiation factor 3 subunit J component [Sarea resinae]|nr:MAG: Translation initiation factor 3 subunit J component [Sarea resinae]